MEPVEGSKNNHFEMPQQEIDRFGNLIDASMSNEIRLARTNSDLFPFSPKLTPFVKFELGLNPPLSNTTYQWEKHLNGLGPERPHIIDIYSPSGQDTHLLINSSFLDLKDGSWTCRLSVLKDKKLPFSISKDKIGFKMFPVPDMFTEENLVIIKQLLQDLKYLKEKYKSPEEEEERQREIKARIRMLDLEEQDTLVNFLQDPIAFYQQFSDQGSTVIPDRLMTVEEADQYKSVQEQIFNLTILGKEKVVVGKPGFGSYMRLWIDLDPSWQDPIHNPTGVVLKKVCLSPEGVEMPQFISTDILSPVLKVTSAEGIKPEQKIVGYTVISTYGSQSGFNHGGATVRFFNDFKHAA